LKAAVAFSFANGNYGVGSANLLRTLLVGDAEDLPMQTKIF
jgi:hypothetical protein